jgi:DNA-directed RNA polymerase specialized sigma24 family protein
LKLAWEIFPKYYGCIDLKGEDLFQQALLSLPPELRCAVILRDIMGCSYQQIAVILDKSEAETAKLISMGRGQFVKLYKKPYISC